MGTVPALFAVHRAPGAGPAHARGSIGAADWPTWPVFTSPCPPPPSVLFTSLESSRALGLPPGPLTQMDAQRGRTSWTRGGLPGT